MSYNIGHTRSYYIGGLGRANEPRLKRRYNGKLAISAAVLLQNTAEKNVLTVCWSLDRNFVFLL